MLSKKTKQKGRQRLFALMSWLSWLTFLPGYELLKLSKSTKEALKEALTDSEAFITQIPARHTEEDEGYYLQTSERFSCITFTPEDMQIRRKHDRPLYYTEYIGSSEVSRIQVNPKSALSIMPRRSCST